METSQEEESFLVYVNLISSRPLANDYGIFNSIMAIACIVLGVSLGHLWPATQEKVLGILVSNLWLQERANLLCGIALVNSLRQIYMFMHMCMYT